MATSQVYISTASRDQLRAIARKHFPMKESEILEKFISDTYELMKKKKTKNKLNNKTVDRTPVNVSTMGDADAPNTSPNEIHVGGNRLYYEEGITYSQFQEKVRKAFSCRR